MSEELLNVLKLCLLALLYLFFFRVLRAVWVELNPPPLAEGPAGGAGASGAPAPRASRRRARKVPTQLTIVDPAAQRGRTFPLASEMTIGRAGGCNVSIPEDTYASQIHARVFSRDGQAWVEDLGSTNGTYVNQNPVSTATPVRRGDLVRVGSTTLELG